MASPPFGIAIQVDPIGIKDPYEFLFARDGFSEVLRLYHLVGTSERVDLARLRRLDEGVVGRDETIAMQQARLHLSAVEFGRRQKRIKEMERVERFPPTARRPMGAIDRFCSPVMRK
jgi:hypothetical protein